MSFSLHRFPRESKVAAVVLGAAIVQVGVLAALGLRSTSERREAYREELKDRGRRVATAVVTDADRRLREQEEKLVQEIARGDASAWDLVQGAMERGVAPVFSYAYLVEPDGRIGDSRRRPYPPGPPQAKDSDARRRLDEVLRLERTAPEQCVAAARGLARDLAPRADGRPRDAVAAALALQSGWRAAYARNDRGTVLQFAQDVLASYRTVRDDRGPLGESEPLGLAAAAVRCDVLGAALLAGPGNAQPFVQAVIERRTQAQQMRGRISEAAYRFETEACARLLHRDGSLLLPPQKGELQRGLELCEAIDQTQERVARHVARSAFLDAARGEAVVRFDADAPDVRSLVTVIPLPRPLPAAGPVAAAFAAPQSALVAQVVEPATRAVALPEGVTFVVRNAAGLDLVQRADGPALLDPVAFGAAAPGLYANVVLSDPSVLELETQSARRLWLAILVGAGFAVVAASLLAVRAVMREVRLARMKSDFVSNLSHELRTPLTSLRMFVDTLREGRVRDEAEAKECLDIVAQETDRLQSLVERVLQFASFTRGRAPIEMRSADAGEVARRAVSVFRKRAEAAEADITLDVEPDLPESILDRDAILQVLLNLLDNAVKYAGHNRARILVGVRAEGPARAGAPRGVVIEVQDDGPGVPERERELVFEEFYRGDDTLSTRVQGTGIGLAVARRIVLAHGGRIEAGRSAQLGGASFRVRLPDASEGRRLVLAAASAEGRS